MESVLSELRIEFASRMSGLILDCGSGDGIYMPYLKGNVISLDIDTNALYKLDGERIQASASMLPFKSDVFDNIWACAVIEHISEDCIPELVRVVKNGGHVAILTPNRLSPIDVIRRLLKMYNWYSHEGHVRLYSVGELEKYCKTYKYKIYGEVRFMPILRHIFRSHPRLSHSVLVYIEK